MHILLGLDWNLVSIKAYCKMILILSLDFTLFKSCFKDGMSLTVKIIDLVSLIFEADIIN